MTVRFIPLIVNFTTPSPHVTLGGRALSVSCLRPTPGVDGSTASPRVVHVVGRTRRRRDSPSGLDSVVSSSPT